MKATLHLPSTSSEVMSLRRYNLLPFAESRPSPLPHVEVVARSGPVFQPSPFGPEVVGVNLTRGCVHRCPFCSVRANPTYPGDDTVFLYANTATHLREALQLRQPRAVYLCPAGDPFPPLAAIQAETVNVLEVLAEHRIETWLMTRGFIRPSAMAVLEAHRELIQVTVAMTTLDRTLQRVLEPLTAPPTLRLRQLARLIRLGIRVHAALEPLFPGITDTRENLSPLLHALADVGVRQMTAGYLFLSPAIRAQLIPVLEGHGREESVLDAFAGAPAAGRYLPKTERQRGYASLMALAAEVGIRVRISTLSNPDFGTARSAAPARPAQRSLF